jgi:acetyl esterase/lipase
MLGLMERFVGAIALAVMATATFASELPTFDVWPGQAPGETGQIGPEKVEQKAGRIPVTLITNVTKPTLTVYKPPADKDTGAAVIICPGGAYAVLAIDLEGQEVARWLNSIGVTGIILKYRVPVRRDTPRYLPPLQDAQRAIGLARSKARDWKIDPHRIGILGFSAGGNLAAFACTRFDERAYEAIDDVDKVSCRPDFGVAVYPAWLVKEGTDELIPELRVTKQTPQMFFAHANDDPISSASSAAMYLALKRAGVPAELHIYSTGGHGFGLRSTTQRSSTWPARCEEWMRNQGILPVGAAGQDGSHESR